MSNDDDNYPKYFPVNHTVAEMQPTAYELNDFAVINDTHLTCLIWLWYHRALQTVGAFASEYFCWNFCSLIGFFVFLASSTAATVVEVSRRDSSTLSRLAYFDSVHYTARTVTSEVGLFIQSHLKSHFNRKSTSSRFWSKSSRFHQIKWLPGL